MQAIADSLLNFIAAHPGLSGFLLFLLSFGEAVVGFGYLVPGTYIMVGAGILVGHGSLGFALACGTLIAGGVVGDALSYWLGHRYSERILAHRFFAKRPKLIARTRALTTRHGPKAVIAARFIGNIRPLVPFLAALCGMKPSRFMFFNVFGALVATPLHLLIGMAIGVGLNFTGAMTARAAIMLALAVLAIWLSVVLTRLFLRVLAVGGPKTVRALRNWAAARLGADRLGPRALARLTMHLLDPGARKALPLLALGLGALACLAGIAEIIEASVEPSPLTVANKAVFAFFQGLRTPWSDDVMVVAVAMGGLYPLLALIGVVLAALLALRAVREAYAWLLACGFAFVLALVVRWLGARYTGDISPNYAITNGHVALTVIVYGYLSFLVAVSSASPQWRAAFGFAAFLLISVVSIAQLYWGVVYVSDLCGGLLLGVFWLLLLFLAGQGRTRPRLKAHLPVVSAAIAAVLVATAAVHATVRHEAELAGFRSPFAETRLSAQAWLAGDWRALPAYRDDFAGALEEPINLQIAGSPDEIAARFMRAGWSVAPAWNLTSAFNLVSGLEDPAKLQRPVLPRLWNGRAERLAYVRASDGGRLIVRLWDQGYWLAPSELPLYLGTVEREIFDTPIFFGLVMLPPRAGDFSHADRALAEDLGASTLRSRRESWRPASSPGVSGAWDGSTVVLDLGSADHLPGDDTGE